MLKVAHSPREQGRGQPLAEPGAAAGFEPASINGMEAEDGQASPGANGRKQVDSGHGAMKTEWIPVAARSGESVCYQDLPGQIGSLGLLNGASNGGSA